MIKAIFFDIDGTLVSFKTHTIPQSTINALSELRAKGIKTFIATGRAYAIIDNLGDLLFDGYITLNGGSCLTGKLEPIYKHSIPSEDIESLIRYQQKNPFPCMFVSSDEFFMNYSTDTVKEIERLINIKPFPIKNIEYAAEKEILQMMTFFTKDEEDRIMKEVLPGCETTRWNPLFTDVVAKGNSKQAGIDKVLEYYGIDLSETMSFGDGGNDISMLKHTPISVAMGNADDDVKQHATYITDSVDDDGIWNALKKFGVI